MSIAVEAISFPRDVSLSHSFRIYFAMVAPTSTVTTSARGIANPFPTTVWVIFYAWDYIILLQEMQQSCFLQFHSRLRCQIPVSSNRWRERPACFWSFSPCVGKQGLVCRYSHHEEQAFW